MYASSRICVPPLHLSLTMALCGEEVAQPESRRSRVRTERQKHGVILREPAV